MSACPAVGPRRMFVKRVNQSVNHKVLKLPESLEQNTSVVTALGGQCWAPVPALLLGRCVRSGQVVLSSLCFASLS